MALVTLVLCLSVLSPLAAGQDVPDARLTVDDVTVAPDRPMTGEPTTVTADVALSAGSASAVELGRVSLHDADGNRLATAGAPGALSPGDATTVDLVAEFETAGRKNLTLEATGTDGDGGFVEIRRPVTVVVEDSPPGISIDATLVEGVESPVTVTVANPSVDAVRNVEVVTLRGDSIDDRAFVPAIAAGGTAVANLTVTPTGDDADVGVRVGYTTTTGDRQYTVSRADLEVEPLRDDVAVEVRPVRQDDAVDAAGAGGIGGIVGGAGGGLQQQDDDEEQAAPEQVEVAVTNFGNAGVDEAVVGPAGDGQFPRRFVGSVAPGETETVTVDLARVPRGDLDVAVSYHIDDEERRSTTTYAHRPSTAAVALTGIDVDRDGERVNVSGNAGNTGEAPVTGVVVAVADAEGVRPTYPRRDYFVGTVDGSEFAPFELTARVTENVSSVPVEVTYRVDGQQYTDRAEVPLEPEPDDGGGGIAGLAPLSVGAGVALTLGVGAAVLLPLYYLRR